jgi:hypothetical protein
MEEVLVENGNLCSDLLALRVFILFQCVSMTPRILTFVTRLQSSPSSGLNASWKTHARTTFKPAAAASCC